MFNKLLLRQLQKHLGGIDKIPADYIPVFKAISDSYDYYEKDRNMISRSMELSSNEMIELNHKMREAKVLAEESVKTKEQFLANMSHEIRTPMSAIIGFTNLVLETKLSDKQAEYLDTINYSAKNLLSIINDILYFSKMKSGKLILKDVNFDLSRFISSMVKMFQLEADKKNIELICVIDPAIPIHLIGDTVRLNQILTNLFSNAIKFTESGHVRLDIKLLNKKDTSNIIEFSVEDTGIGISGDKLESVFESFTQAYNDSTRKYGGTGLGLAIVKALVELYGGQIRAVNNKGGQGTTFVFTLSLKDGLVNSQNEKEGEGQKKQQEKCRNLNGVRVLIAEDNKSIQQLTMAVLNQMGCEVELAENGREAIEKLKNAVYDIILMDIQMPEMDGYEATRYIRTELDIKMNKIPIIAMTAHALNDDGAKCILAGMNDYISKPFEKEVLYKKINELVTIEKRSLPDQLATENSAFPIQSETEKDTLDLTYLKNILGDSNDFLLDVLDMLNKEFPIMTENLRVSGIDKNWKQLRQDAHKMKSSVMMLNKPHLMALLESIEKYAGEESQLESLPELVKQATFLNYLVIVQLKAELDKL